MRTPCVARPVPECPIARRMVWLSRDDNHLLLTCVRQCGHANELTWFGVHDGASNAHAAAGVWSNWATLVFFAIAKFADYKMLEPSSTISMPITRSPARRRMPRTPPGHAAHRAGVFSWNRIAWPLAGTNNHLVVAAGLADPLELIAVV